ncbi:MAG: CvpA family protein [Acidobacteria bacterium]|nr:CvpA family protein [Acidobacteriota bacterium]
MSRLTAFDYLVAVILLSSTVFALVKGFAREMISLGALVLGFLLAAWYYPLLAAPLADWIRNQTIAGLIGFLVIFLGCLAAGAVAGYLVKRFVKTASLEWIDHLLGGAFGLLRGWAAASVLVLALVAFPVRESVVEKSLFSPYLLAGARAAVLMVPRELKDKFYAQYEKVIQSWNRQRTTT